MVNILQVWRSDILKCKEITNRDFLVSHCSNVIKQLGLNKISAAALIVCALFISINAQRKTTPPAARQSKSIVFAVLNDGKTLEPIAEIEKGKLIQTTGGESDEKMIAAFVNSYYKPKSTYKLVFGGANDGTVTINSSNPKSDCAKNLAEVSLQSVKGKIKGLVMGLATNESSSKTASGVRRFPTPAERAEIESLVRAEFIKQKLSESVVKNLRYHNLTALDPDNDGKAEMVGSFWVEATPNERHLLFLIAEKGSDGKYSFNHSQYNKVTSDDVMSGEIKALDDGIYTELLIDVLDVDNDGVAEIFTIIKGFEGNNFIVYNRQNGKWTNYFEASNYHCAF